MSRSTASDLKIDLSDVYNALDDQGYTVIPSVISPEQADEVKDIVTSLLASEIKEDHKASGTQRIGRIAVKHPIFVDLMCHPFIVEIWENWLAEDMICSTWTSNTYYPGYDSFGWHADYPYWSLAQPWPTGNFTGQTIWMLDDFNEDNGATGVVPGSHKILQPPEHADEWHDDAVVLTGVRGSVALLHGALWHTGRPNITSQPRSCLLGMYIRPHCLPMEDMRGQLNEIEAPSERVTQIMGGHQRQPEDVKG